MVMVSMQSIKEYGESCYYKLPKGVNLHAPCADGIILFATRSIPGIELYGQILSNQEETLTNKPRNFCSSEAKSLHFMTSEKISFFDK